MSLIVLNRVRSRRSFSMIVSTVFKGRDATVS